MKLQLVPASTGFQWVMLALQTFRSQPMALTSLFVIAVVAMSTLSVLPLIGPVVALALLPVTTLTMMVAAAEASRGRRPTLGLLLVAFRSGPQRLQSMLTLGAMYAAGFLLILGISSFVDGGLFATSYLGERPITRELADTPEFRAAMWVCLALYLPLSMLFWHAPGLVHWHNIAPVKAVFFSVVACVRNIRAFCVYTLAWAGVVIAASVALTLIIGVLALALPSGFGSLVGGFVMTLAAVSLAAMYFCSIVFSFRDCFSPPGEDDDTQTHTSIL